ncbi:hypothetical protein FH972_023672 [Carpinus fangiana]|uniref:Exocyst complex component n=1 Tax=Carpinus fangiana TaxID=176857 RepID=A0A5N6KWH1_9ROSI|nr:hypothetical protein FH972_023672 [Carpinus fangiana]
MPARLEPTFDNGPAVRQIIAPGTDAEFLDHLIEGMHGANPTELVHSLERMAVDRDAEIEDMCTSNHQEFINSVNELDRGRDDCTSLGSEILNLVQSYQTNTDNLAAQKKNLVDSRSVRQNVDESADSLRQCLEVLRLSNQVHELVGKQNHYAALRALDDLRSLLRLRESSRYKVLELIEKSIPATQKMIAEAVMTDLNTWLYHIRDVSQYIGEVAMFNTEQRRTRQKERGATDDYLATFKLNSPIELVADETDEFDVLNNEEAEVNVDFTPLFECLHIHEALDQLESFRTEYAITRRRQKELIVPTVLRLTDVEASELKELLESIVGFSIIEKATMRKTEGLRSAVDVDELWDSMCQSAITLMSSAIQTVDNAEMLLKVTGVVSLFIQTMESWGYHASSLNHFLMTLFEKYAFLLKKRCSEDFQEIVATDDYMPMPISTIEEYDKIIDVGWYTPDKPREEIVFPCVLPFSQMYPMCCIDIRNFLNQVYSAPDDTINRSSLIDETIRNSLDELLSDRICQPLIERLRSQYPGQIVQILTNFEHFERACIELQGDLAQARAARSRTGPVVLKATKDFHAARQKARDRIFELVNSKINDLIETAEYNWNAMGPVTEPSNYMTELTRYLSNIMNSVLLGLPTDVKDLIYFDALSNAATGILSLPLDPSVPAISPSAMQLLVLDVQHLTSFVAALPQPTSTQLQRRSTSSNAALKDAPVLLNRTVEELSQTISLMASEDPNEFFDISLRSKKYAAVDARNGPVLLDKVEKGSHGGAVQGDGASMMSTNVGGKEKTSERFRRMMGGLRNVGEANRD